MRSGFYTRGDKFGPSGPSRPGRGESRRNTNTQEARDRVALYRELGGKRKGKGGSNRPSANRPASNRRNDDAPLAPPPPLPPDPNIEWEQQERAGEEARERMYSRRPEQVRIDLSDPYNSALSMARAHDDSVSASLRDGLTVAKGSAAAMNRQLSHMAEFIKPPDDVDPFSEDSIARIRNAVTKFT